MMDKFTCWGFIQMPIGYIYEWINAGPSNKSSCRGLLRARDTSSHSESMIHDISASCTLCPAGRSWPGLSSPPSYCTLTPCMSTIMKPKVSSFSLSEGGEGVWRETKPFRLFGLQRLLLWSLISFKKCFLSSEDMNICVATGQENTRPQEGDYHCNGKEMTWGAEFH